MAQTFTSFTPVEEAEAAPPANFTSFTPLEEAAPAAAPDAETQKLARLAANPPAAQNTNPALQPSRAAAPPAPTPVIQKPAAPPAAPPVDLEARLAAQEAKRAEFSPLEEGKKGVISAATVGIPSMVEQFKLAGVPMFLVTLSSKCSCWTRLIKGKLNPLTTYLVIRKCVHILLLIQKYVTDCVSQSLKTWPTIKSL